MSKNHFFGLLLSIFVTQSALCQQITGKITDKDAEPIPGVSVVIKGTKTGTASNIDGDYTITANKGHVLVFTCVGFNPKEITITNTIENITLEYGVDLDEIILVGNRVKPRTIIDSPVPIDNIGVDELRNTGQPTVDKMLTYRVPSFNSTTQSISDATAHFDPADLRGLGPSRTLVLINGKRKNQSALVYINDTPGKGEVGVDLKSIPEAAIDRIEVLRDGASAQYGSDAIAGVINMVLKKKVEYSTLNVTSGITTKGDGFNIGGNFNSSINIGKSDGYLNFTASYYEQNKTNRPGAPGEDVLIGVPANDPTWGTWLKENPSLGMNIGQPELEKTSLYFNSGIPIKNDKGEFYAFGGVTFRNGKSFALYRAPYWVSDPHNLLHEAGTAYQGFQPTFETAVRDNNFTVGTLWDDVFGFNIDLSGTYGRNAIDYEVNNTLNPALGANSPTSFDVGAYAFDIALANLDFSRSIGNLNIAFGAEARKEQFKAYAGQPESYFGNGAQSFPGLQPANAVKASRNNLGVYGDLEWEALKKLLLGGAVRFEDFSDFGNNTSWKLNGRYLLGDSKGAIRASYSTGFRAPSLHQIYLSNIQTLVSGGSVSNQGTFNNVDPVIKDGLGVPHLTAETSNNITAGFTFKPLPNLSLALDFYNVKVNNRVLFTGEIGYNQGSPGDPKNPVEVILDDNAITSLKFFVNAVSTKTNGADLVINYKNITIGNGKLGATLSGNLNETKIIGKINTPKILEENGYDIFNRKEQSRITSSRPKSKVLLGLDYNINNWDFILNNTYFGKVEWKHANNGLNGVDLGNGPLPLNDSAYDQIYSGKIITDLVVNYKFTKSLSANVSANNLLNIYPDVIDTKGDFLTDLGGRFKYAWEVNQFGFNGTTLNLGLTYKF